MNIDHIETIVKQSCKDAYEEFKHSINNCPFDILDADFVKDALSELNITIGTKCMKKVMSIYSPSAEQMKIIINTIDYYKAITLRVAHSYGFMVVG